MTTEFTYGSLFSGIGGLDLGLDRAGMRCVWQVESNPFARKILAKHWPHVRKHDDVRTFLPQSDRRCDSHRDSCDLVCGGFPCQDVSKAGNVQGERIGLAGSRSGLWREYLRIVRQIRPRYVLVENVARLLVRGIEQVLGDLATLGYDAEWHCLPAAAFGACHIRDRVFILAYADSVSVRLQGRSAIIRTPPPVQAEARQWDRLWTHPFAVGSFDGVEGDWSDKAWHAEPDVGRMVDGVSCGLDRNRSLGNAVVPQIAEYIGRRIMEFEKESPR